MPDTTATASIAPARRQQRRPAPLRGGSFTLLVLRPIDPKDEVMYAGLADKVAQAPSFFRHAPLVIDLGDLAEAPPINMAELGRRLRQHWFVPVGVQNGTPEQNRAAINAGFSILREGCAAPLSLDIESSVTTVQAPANGARGALAAATGGKSKVVTQPVRSGQQVYAQQGDLILLSSISPGAELVADGHIHVYGPLRGRALAGVSGDASARIFCRSLEAELVSVAGFWRVREDLPEALIGKPVQIFLDGETVMIEPIG
jgi:septum site-determining protein MinC